ncbi:MAG: hypothetical protein VB100_04580 [Angelakisella sp.]|nr:hypothetical protein [Angelakisella sp.]
MRDAIKKICYPFCTTILVALFPILFLYFNNAGIVSLSEALPLCIIFSGIALAIFVVVLAIIRSSYKSSLIASVFCVMLFNFALIEKALKIVFDTFYYWQMVLLVLFIVVHIVWLIWRKCSLSLAKDICNIVCIVLSGLIVFNGALAAPKIVNKISAEKKLQQEKSKEVNVIQNTDVKPNIYLLIFDEFAGFAQMEQAYGYDNKTLKDFLMKNGFTISYNSRNESISTTTVTTNIVNLDYIVDDNTTPADKQVKRETGKLFSIMQEQHGYEIRKLSSKFDYYGDSSVSLVSFEENKVKALSGEGFEDLLIQQTIIYPFKINDSAQELESLKGLYSIVDFLCTPENISDDSTLTFAHLPIPHQPFIVDSFGNLISPDDANNWVDPNIYKGQYIYSTKLMIDILTNLKENDPNSLIIVMSDHGARHSEGVTGEKSKTLLNNILNSFYYQGADLSEYVDKSAVNTLRLLLNRAIGTNFEEVEVPIFDQKKNS